MNAVAPVKCPCHSTPEAHEKFVARFVSSLLDGSRYAMLPEVEECDGAVSVEYALEVRS